MSALGSRSDVGHFAAAHMGVVLFYSLSWLFGSVLLTDFTRLASDPSKFDGYAARWTKMLLSVGGVGALALYFVAPLPCCSSLATISQSPLGWRR